MNRLVIAEKPSVAQSIAAVLGAKTRNDGYLSGSGYMVSWCYGHLAELSDASAYNANYARWRMKDLPILPRAFKYSMLIYLQRPDASLVAGFQKWKTRFGRHVKQGERGITIIAPTPFKKKIEEVKLDPDTNAPMLDKDGRQIVEEREISVPMFKPVKVFDVSQTNGKPLPQLAATLTGSVEQYDVFVEALRRTAPVPVFFAAIQANTDGYFSLTEQSITIRAGMSQVQSISALVHEIAHSKLHNYEKQQEEGIQKDRHTEEVEAESISYAVCQYFGIQTGENSFGYIASWSQGKELKELRASLETINKTASGLITDIEKHCAEICKERGIDPKAIPEQAVETASEPPKDPYQEYAESACAFLRGQYLAGELNGAFHYLTDTATVRNLTELLRNGNFQSARGMLIEAAEQSDAPQLEEFSKKLEALSDRWDRRLSYRIEPNELHPDRSILLAVEPRPDGPKEHGILFSGPTPVCEKLLRELRDGTMTARQARAMQEQWERAEKLPLGEPERLYLLDEASYLHMQSTDNGFDYSLYDAQSLKLIDGGQFSVEGAKMHPAATVMDGAFQEVCVLQGLEPTKVETVPLEKLEEILAANAIPPQPEKAPSVAALDTYPLPDIGVAANALEEAGYMAGDMLPLSMETAKALCEQDCSIYAIVDGGRAELCFDAEEIESHSVDAVFAIPREEWEGSIGFHSAVQNRMDRQQVREAAFLACPEDCFNNGNYLKAAELTVEDDCGMIDGIINNGQKQPTLAEPEGQVRAGPSISLLDLAKAAQTEEKKKPRARTAAPKAKEEGPSILDRLKQPRPKQTKKAAPHRSAEKELI